MNIGVLGTGVVGQTIGAKLAGLGHAVTIGTRDVGVTLARSEPGLYGNPPFKVWQQAHPAVRLATFAEAAAIGEVLFNCTSGTGSLEALRLAGEASLNGKILIDIANPLDYSRGMPPTLTVCNTDSLGEQIQRAFPRVKVVKALNTMNAYVMVDPSQVAGGEHHVFVSGNDAGAKAEVSEILQNWFGWKHVLDLGDITAARGMEMYLPLWLRLMGAVGAPLFNVMVVK